MSCPNCKDGICQNKCQKSPSFPYKNEPSPFQRKAIVTSFKSKAYALFHAMGAGKTFSAINVMCARFMTSKFENKIDAAVIICPTSIKSVWLVEFDKHAPCPINAFVYEAGGDAAFYQWAKKDKEGLKVLIIGVEALSQGKAFDRTMEFLENKIAMVVCDESSRIKNHSADRTKKAFKISHACKFRMILTGTPVSQGMQDLFSQFYFLDPSILGMKSFVLFRNMYCVMGGFQNRAVIGFQNVPSLMDKIRPYCDIVTKEEAMPQLPPKIYSSPIVIKPTREQKAVMEQLHREFMAEQSGDVLNVSTVMDRLTRYQQICGGFYPHDDEENNSYKVRPIDGKNPKLDVLLELCEQVIGAGDKAIIWARFRPELELIAAKLNELYGAGTALPFHGGVSLEDRATYTRHFENGKTAKFMVANATVGGMGQTWVAATHTFYYSNTFSYEDRMQSEDRNHRRGQHNSVVYHDLVMDVKADHMILKALAKKHDLAMEVRDGIKKGTNFGAEGE